MSCELFLRLSVGARARRFGALAVQIWRRLASDRISDHWKEQASLMYARKLLGASMILAACTWLCLTPMLVGLLLAAGSAERLVSYALRPDILVGSLLLSIVYVRVRARFRA